MEWKGKTAIVTGASAGIGAAVAELLHGKGVNLLVCGQREERLVEMAARWPGTQYQAGDIAEPEAPSKLIGQALDAFGSCDIVINNAGIMESGEIATIDLDKVCRMIRVNVEGATRMAYEAVRHFLAAGAGHLITTTSVLGTKVKPFVGAYASTKFALEALTESLRMELSGTGVRVGCVEPGITMTELHRDYAMHPGEARGLKRVIEPMDVARCVIFMLEQPAHVFIPKLMLLPSEDEI